MSLFLNAVISFMQKTCFNNNFLAFLCSRPIRSYQVLADSR